jgi:regulator of protease activity HflC (stomatin/prohibitin superfamily)
MALSSLPNTGSYRPKVPRGSAIYVAAGAVFLLVLYLLLNSFITVGPGERGVLMTWGAASPNVLSPGLHFVVPVAEGVELMNVRTQNYVNEDSAASADLQEVQTEISVNYHVDPADAVTVFQRLGGDDAIGPVVLAPAVSNAVKAVTAAYNAQDLITERDAVRSRIEDQIRAAMTPFSIVIDAVNITNFAFSPDYTAAIEAKQVAQQKAQQAQYTLQQAEVNAQQTVVEAKAQAEANNLKQASITPGLIAMTAAQEWDGHLPQYLGAGAPVPFLSMDQAQPAAAPAPAAK